MRTWRQARYDRLMASGLFLHKEAVYISAWKWNSGFRKSSWWKEWTKARRDALRDTTQKGRRAGISDTQIRRYYQNWVLNTEYPLTPVLTLADVKDAVNRARKKYGTPTKRRKVYYDASSGKPVSHHSLREQADRLAKRRAKR